MNKYDFFTLLALTLFVVALPLYARREPKRLEAAQAVLQAEILSEAAIIYLENCAECHGSNGAGLGITPPLNGKDLAAANPQALFRVIARAAHGSPMAAWHIREGGVLNDYQIQKVVTLLQNGHWHFIQQVAETEGFAVGDIPDNAVEDSFLISERTADPHRCFACHEEPAIHAGLFGVNCGRCHSSQAWVPALLVRHNFLLDHGSQDQTRSTCQTCHVSNYFEYSCYECHEHRAEAMTDLHPDQTTTKLEDCVLCHPTGVAGEAERLLSATEYRGDQSNLENKAADLTYTIEELDGR